MGGVIPESANQIRIDQERSSEKCERNKGLLKRGVDESANQIRNSEYEECE
jgi:hypothetical protein